MALGVESLERRQREARETAGNAARRARAGIAEAVNSDPKGAENGPHQYTYKPSLYPEQDTVMASEGCKSGVARPVSDTAPRSSRTSDTAQTERPEQGRGPNDRPGPTAAR